MAWLPSSALRCRRGGRSGLWRTTRCSRRARSLSCSSSRRRTRRLFLATARRLGLSTTAAHPQPHSHSGAARRAPRHERRQVDAAAAPRRNARQRRSARRSAERHRKRQLIIRSRIVCLLFVIRLRRRVRLRRDLGDLDELTSQSSQEAVVKRDRPSSRSDSDTAVCDRVWIALFACCA